MDLNSYLTEFFSMISNQNIHGGNGLSGGAPPSGVTFGPGLTNQQILAHYFKPDSITGATVDSKLVFLDDAKKNEFVKNQVEIVKYMLNDPTMRGGMYGGADEETKLAAAAAATVVDPASVPVGVPGGVPGECSLLMKIKSNAKQYDGSDFNVSDSKEIQKCFDSIILYIKRNTDKEDQKDERNDIFLRCFGAVLTKLSDEDDNRNNYCLLLHGYVF
jgi:hypothetical protein